MTEVHDETGRTLEGIVKRYPFDGRRDWGQALSTAGRRGRVIRARRRPAVGNAPRAINCIATPSCRSASPRRPSSSRRGSKAGLDGDAQRRQSRCGRHAESRRRCARDRNPRRHGRAADRRGKRQAVGELRSRRDARVRPRRPYDDAARRRAAAREDAQLLRHRASRVPARRRSGQSERRAANDRRRAVRAFPVRRDLRIAQPSRGADRNVPVRRRAVHVGFGHGEDHDPRPRRQRGAPADRAPMRRSRTHPRRGSPRTTRSGRSADC